MALPPTIPTSFVPKQPVSTQLKRQKAGMNPFMFIGGAVLLVSLLAAAGTFGYAFYLSGARDAKAAALDEAQRAVDIDSVESFVRLKNRLGSAEALLDRHVELSEFFSVIEEKTISTVRFSGLRIAVDEGRAAEIEMEGVARTFNALAAQSTELASEKRIKRAIFSDISVNENGTVSFSLRAIADPRLITQTQVFPGVGDPIDVPASVTDVAPEPVLLEPELPEAGTAPVGAPSTSSPVTPNEPAL